MEKENKADSLLYFGLMVLLCCVVGILSWLVGGFWNRFLVCLFGGILVGILYPVLWNKFMAKRFGDVP